MKPIWALSLNIDCPLQCPLPTLCIPNSAVSGNSAPDSGGTLNLGRILAGFVAGRRRWHSSPRVHITGSTSRFVGSNWRGAVKCEGTIPGVLPMNFPTQHAASPIQRRLPYLGAN